ncbi:heterokaryon incompatibility protein-domain-containing protein, partial [Fusarium tricinctum]
MKRWMVQSRDNHEHVNTLTRLPTRVLKASKDSQEVILCNLEDQYAEYAALSHCWGSCRPFMLTSNTIHSLRSGIPTSDLPQSFQDALWLTHQLQIPYLWIDSLCILQDNPNDWIRESSRMSEVYGNASLTIAACRARDSSQGFLGPRTLYEKITLPFQVNGISSEVFAYAPPLKYVGEPSRIIDLEDEPLSRRAWTLQERYLSPRILHFTKSQTYFEYASSFLSEDGCALRPPPSNPDAVIGQYLIPKATSQCWRTWRKIVTRYSRRNLTFDADKLPALGGIAARFAAESIGENGSSDLSDCYLAGLWRDDLIRGLCWRSELPDLSSAGISQAPTWSWASTRSSIYYGTNWFDKMEELAVVRDARVERETPGNLFGRVTGGRI